MTLEQLRKSYIITQEAYYFDGHPGDVVDEVYVQIQPIDPMREMDPDQPIGGFAIAWVAGSRSPRLSIHSDAWPALWTHCRDLLAALVQAAEDSYEGLMGQPEIVDILDQNEFMDATVRENPRSRPLPTCPHCRQELPASGSGGRE